MSCKLSDARLDFPTSGIAVRPYEIRVDSEMGKYSYATVRVSVAAGRLVAGSLSDTEPVRLSLNGIELAYMAIEPDGIQESNRYSTLRLRDPRVILDRGVVSGEYDEITLSAVVNEVIFPAIVDPNGVLQRSIIADADTLAASSEAYETVAGKFTKDVVDYLEDLETELPEWLARWSAWSAENDEEADELADRTREVAGIVGDIVAAPIRAGLDLGGRSGGFRFDEVTPAEALKMVEAEFEIDSWVEDGVLYVGYHEASANLGVVGTRRGELYLSDWNVVDTSTSVSTVISEGAYYDTIADPDRAHPSYYRGRAVASLAEGLPQSGKVVFLDPKRAVDLVELEQRAEQRIRQEAFDSSSGTLVINSSATRGADLSPFDISLGDTLLVVPQKVRCGENVPGGVLAVTGVMHKISPDVGWKTTVSVGRILRDSDVVVKSYLTNSALDSWVSADEWYEQEQSPSPRVSGGEVV